MGDDQPAAAGVNAARHADPSPRPSARAPQSVYYSASLSPRRQQQQQHDAGAASSRVTSPPTAAMSMSQPPLLPPLQQQQQAPQPHYDGAQFQAQPPLYGQPMQHHHHPTYAPQHHYPYANGAAMAQAPPMPSNMVVNGNGTMRYALPPQMAPGNMARNANAKQIKRRTKTGCLTCRKRRIKCDEAHPTCRNCQKSKRECLGYDPIFKQQTGPATIQPAPSAATASNRSTSPSLSHGQSYSPSQQYANAAGGYLTLPRPGQADNTLEFATGLDSTLGTGEQPIAMSHSLGPSLQPVRKVSSIIMADLFALNDVDAQWQQREAPPPDFSYPEVEQFYRFHYAQGLDKLFETTWYTTHGWSHMQHDPTLLDFIGQCSEQMKSSADDAVSIQAIASLEARLVWQLSSMPRLALSSTQAYGAIGDPLLSDLLPRIDTVENILTGQFLPVIHIPPSPSVEHRSDPRKHNEMHFWHQLGRIASIHDDSPSPAATREINDALAAMRSVLGLMENRDVLYSLAIVRFIGGRVDGYDPLVPLQTTGKQEAEVDKLETARSFVVMEAEKGMTQVVQRVCGMAMRAAVLKQQQQQR